MVGKGFENSTWLLFFINPKAFISKCVSLTSKSLLCDMMVHHYVSDKYPTSSQVRACFLWGFLMLNSQKLTSPNRGKEDFNADSNGDW